MPQKAVVDAVEARLLARWSSPEAVAERQAAGLPECPVLGINITGETPPDGDTYLQVQYPVANVSQMDLAGTIYREEGAVRLILNVQRGADFGPGLTMAGGLATLFRGRKFDGVQTFSPSSPVIDDRNEEGMYFSLSISIPYQFDFVDQGGFYA